MDGECAIAMTKFDIQEKIITSSKCRLMRYSKDPDPLFCKVLLTQDVLILLNDEYLKQDELILRIKIDEITDFIFLNQKKQKKGNVISFLGTLIGTIFFAIGGSGFYVNNKNDADILYLTYINDNGEEANYILDMMQNGERGIIKEYMKIVGKRNS